MNELPQPEIEREITREGAMAAYKQFVDKGITNPDDLDLNDPSVLAANKLFYKWQKQGNEEAKDNCEHGLRNNLDKTMFYIDAGFTDREYLDKVLNDWLAQDTLDTEKQIDNPDRAMTRRLYSEAIRKIRKLLQEKDK